MVCNIRGIYHFYVINLIVIENRTTMIIVWVLQGSVSNKDVFSSL